MAAAMPEPGLPALCAGQPRSRNGSDVRSPFEVGLLSPHRALYSLPTLQTK